MLVASTGIIGRPLAMERLRAGIPLAAAALSADGGEDASNAICTTDAYPKTGEETVVLAGGEVRLGAMAKGAGMIRPDMATMICQVTTDVAIDPAQLQRLLVPAVQRSFNRISVDGSASTNDTVFVLANGASGVTATAADDEALGAALERLLLRLAKLVVSRRRGLVADRALRGLRRARRRRRPRSPCARSPRTSSCAARCTAPTRTGAAC